LEKGLISASPEWTVPVIKLRTALRSARLAAVLLSDDGTNANAALVCGGHAWWH
jgi:hypothetical protein